MNQPNLLNGTGRSSNSLTDEAYAILKDEILECRLAPGDRLTEAAVSARLEIGKTPIREALRNLVRDGLVQVVPRHGYRITPITLSDVQELFGLRLVVEPASVVLAIAHLTNPQLDRLEELAEVEYVPGDRNQMQIFLQANIEFHYTIAQASQNNRLAELVKQLLTESQRLINFGVTHHPQREQTRREHRQLCLALCDRDANTARQLAEDHLRATQQMVVDSLMVNTTLREVPITAS
ncbi:MAG TPA: GntR family transcriptional regulator [Crinalium sp.]|jgi:DNA-binding GntR family transcriptional regulator